MKEYFINYMIVTHEDESKVNDLYQNSHEEELFDYIFPPPVELINDTNAKTVNWPRMISVSDKLRKWRWENWGTRSTPSYDSSYEKRLSKDGSIFTIKFDTFVTPPIGIFEELHRQGFRIKAYYAGPVRYSCFGSYIYGIHEHFICKEPHYCDLPPDIHWCFTSRGEKINITYCDDQNVDDTHDEQKDLDKANKPKVLSDDDNLEYFDKIAEISDLI